MGALFVGLMAIGANIAIWLPFLKVSIGGASVPISLQTFFATLAGLMLGKRLGSFSMLVYLCVGAAGIPVFAEMKAGISTFATGTGGFLLSFIFVAWFAGWVVEKSQRLSPFPTYFLASLAGLMANYMIGTNFLYVALIGWIGVEASYTAVWLGMVPFFIKDFALTFFAASLAVALVSRVRTPLQSSTVRS
nr:biotin transporter BioY [Salirhabdus salicampi]